jgi:hypothetical protein
MSYNERPDGYKGVKYGAMAMTLLGAAFLLKMSGGLAGIMGGLPAMTPLAAQAQLLNDPQSGPLFHALQNTYPDEFDGLTKELARRGAEFEGNQDIINGGRAYLLAAMKRHLGEIAQAPHSALSDYRKAEIATLQTLQTDDVASCAAYFATGLMRPAKPTPAIKTAMMNLQIKTWTTAAAGRDHSAKRIIAKPEVREVKEIASSASQAGSDENAVEMLLTGVPLDGKVGCSAGLALLQGIDALPDARADNFTAFMLQTAATKS